MDSTRKGLQGVVLGVAFLVAAVNSAQSQERARPQLDPGRRPRIGLVLSGGSARGCAHVGVLKVLEELRVPVDVIAATSMGAIVGGTYAAGLSPEAIEQVLVETDWQDVFTDRRVRPELPFRRKEEDFRYLSGMELGVSHGRIIPRRGFIAGQKLDFLLTRYTLRASGIEEFDRLPIPFRCVATDLVTGQKVVFSGGDLATALRASMSLPAIFAPVEVGDQVLADGGLVDNLPVDVAREMGAEVVIAVNVGAELGGRERLDSVVGIARQVTNLLGEESVRKGLADADLVIAPDLGEIGGMDFSRAAEIIRIGETAARRSAQALSRFSVSEDDYLAFLARHRGLPFLPVTVKFLQVEGVSRVDSGIVTSRIRVKPGEPLDLDTLREDLARLYDIGDFESVGFRLVRVGGDWGLIIRAREKPWGPNYLRFSMNLVDDLQGNSTFTLSASHTRTQVNRLGAEWRTDLQAGRNRVARTEFYQPVDSVGRWFVAAAAEADSIVYDVFESGRKLAEYRADAHWGAVHLGLNIARLGELRLGLLRGSGHAKASVGAPGFPTLDVAKAGATVRVVIDRLDNVDFPHHGMYGVLDGFFSRRRLGADLSYDRLAVGFNAFTTSGRQTYLLGLWGGSSLGSELPVYEEFTLGGLISLSGYRVGELRGQYFGVGRLGGYRRIGRLGGSFLEGVYFGGWAEAGNTWGDRNEIRLDNLRFAGTMFLGVETRLGPLSVAVGQAERGRRLIYLSLGRRL